MISIQEDLIFFYNEMTKYSSELPIGVKYDIENKTIQFRQYSKTSNFSVLNNYCKSLRNLTDTTALLPSDYITMMNSLKSFGIEIPEDKQADVKKALSEHYKNAKEVAKTLTKVEGERDDWKERAETAEETLKGFDGIDPANIQTELAGWKKKAEDAEKEFNAKIYDRDFSDALKTALDDVKFSSDAAKRSVMADIKEAGLKLKDGKILGLNDLIEQMKQSDASAFVDESQQQAQQNQARFTTHVGQQQTPGSMTKKDIEAIKDPSERQAAIAQNIQLFQ